MPIPAAARIIVPMRHSHVPAPAGVSAGRCAAIAAVVLSVAGLAAQTRPAAPSMRGDGPAPASKPFSITRNDPSLDALVAPDAKAELMARGFGLNEGPVWVREGRSGYLLVGGLLDNVIYKVAADKTVSVFMERAGYTGTDVNHTGAQTRSGRSHVLLIGPSCASLDSQGRVIWCADNDRAVMRLEKDGTRTVLSSGLNGKKFSGPNDIAVTSKDAVYLTDNDFGLRDGGQNPDKQLENGIWLIKDGTSTMVLDAKALGGIPNGIALSPDEKTLYATAGAKINRYDVKTDGTLGPGTLFTEGPGIGDGMKVDVLGNLYSTSGAGPGIVRITSPAGKLLGMLNLEIVGGEPKRQICATNVAFGDADGRGLYVTACDAVYRIRMKVQGVMPGPLVAESAQRPAPPRTAARAPARAPVRPSPAHADVNQLMRGVLYPAANVVFFAQADDPAAVKPVGDPSMATDPLASAFGGWQAIENAALALAESASLMEVPGRVCSNGVSAPTGDPAWTAFVQEVRDASLQAYAAARTKDQARMVAVSETLSVACAGCHRKWRDRRPAASRCK